jgi:MscS family membrane protein
MAWESLFLGNTIAEYAIFLGILLLGLAAGKAVSWMLKNVIKSFASNTVTKIDDVLVDVFDGPLVFAVFVAMLWYAKRTLVLSEGMMVFYDHMLYILVVWTLAWFIIRFLDSVIENYLTPYAAKSKSDIDDVLIPILQTVVKFVVICIAAIMVLSYFGFNVMGLVAGLGIGGLAIAFAAKDILGNMFGGISIIADKPFKIGDMIKFDSRQGTVRQIGIRTTRIETLDGTQLIIPNQKFTEGIIENVTNRQRHRVSLVLGLQYDTTTKQLKKAREILAALVKKNKKTAEESTVFFSNFGASSVDLTLIYFITDLQHIPHAQDEINMAIKEEFEKAKISFAYPTQTVILKK